MPQRCLIILGTRPEAIKMAPLVEALRGREEFQTRVCVTAQHRQMLDQVLRVFAIQPDDDLNLMQANQSLNSLAAAVLTGVQRIVSDYRPHWVLVQGDTTTALAAALAAFYQRTAVAHVEAGLRTGNLEAPFPEEGNRRAISAIASLHLAPTQASADNLRREAIDEARIVVTGNTVIDALLATVQRLQDPRWQREAAAPLPDLPPRDRVILVTAHRRENLGQGLRDICSALATLADEPGVHVVFPVHLNPSVRQVVHEALAGRPRVHLLEPLDYLSFVLLMTRCRFLITDSGGVQEEAPALGKPVLVLRDTTERPETLGAPEMLVGTDPSRIVVAARRLLHDPAYYAQHARPRFTVGDGQAAQRIVDALLQRSPSQG